MVTVNCGVASFPCFCSEAMSSAGKKCVLTITSHGSDLRNRRNGRRLSFSAASRRRSVVRRGETRAIHQVVKVAQHVRRFVDEVEIRLRIDTAKGGIRQLEHVDILDDGLRIELFERQLDSLRRPQMPCTTDADSTNTRLDIA